MSTPVQLVLSKLADLKPNGDGKGWSARCPAHDDRAPSLSVSEGEDGRALVHCHAGCTPEAIVGALGLSMKDLMSPKPVQAPGGRGKKRIVATYDYRDEENQLLFQVVRYDPKNFRQRRPAGKNKWSWSVKGVRQVPYRLPALLKHPPDKWVLVCEGEKDVDRLAALGIVATTNAGGAGKWRREFAEHLRGRWVAIPPDNDESGRKHAQEVAASLFGIAAGFKIVELPGLPEKGDVSDWLDAGGTKEALAKLVLAAPVWQPNAGGAKGETAQKGKNEPPPFVPFPTDVLPSVPRNFVRHGAKALGCDESYVAVPLLAALASAVGNTRRIRLKATWCEPCVVWAVIVGESGTLKSPALDLVLKPLHDLQAAAFVQYREAMQQYARDKATFDADLNEWKKKGRKAGEPPPDEPEEPVALRYVCADTTMEALAVLLERQPRGLLMARDELSGWCNSFDAYKSCRGADVAHWLSMHRAGPLIVDRKTGRKVIHVPRGAVSIAGGVQPGPLAAALVGRYSPQDGDDPMARPPREHFDNGLAARLLFTLPPPKPKRWTDADLPANAESAMRRLFDGLLALDFEQDEEGEPVPIDVPLSPEGKAAWIAFYNEHAAETAELKGDLAAAWSKLEGYAARFALLIHLIRLVSGDPPLADPGAVDSQSVKAGVALARWFADEAARVYAKIGGDKEAPEAREQREVVRIMRAHGGEITVRELMRSCRRYRGCADKAERLLLDMVHGGKAEVWTDTHKGGGGRPRAVFTLTDPGDGNKTHEKPEEGGVLSPSPEENEGESVSGVQETEEVVEWTG